SPSRSRPTTDSTPEPKVSTSMRRARALRTGTIMGRPATVLPFSRHILTEESCPASRRVWLLVARALVDAPRHLGQELVGEAKQLADAPLPQAVVTVAAALLPRDQAAVEQAPQMVRGVRLAEPGLLHDLAHAPWPLAERLQNGEARGVGEAAKELRLEREQLGVGAGEHPVCVSGLTNQCIMIR